MRAGFAAVALAWAALGGALAAKAAAEPYGAAKAAAEPAGPPAGEASGSVTTVVGSEAMKLRDPFKRPTLEGAGGIPKTDLENFQVENIRMVGMLSGPTNKRAMVLAPNGKTYLVADGTKIGIRSGVVTKINPDSIEVKEKIVNVLGQEEEINTVLHLPDEARSAQ